MRASYIISSCLLPQDNLRRHAILTGPSRTTRARDGSVSVASFSESRGEGRSMPLLPSVDVVHPNPSSPPVLARVPRWKGQSPWAFWNHTLASHIVQLRIVELRAVWIVLVCEVVPVCVWCE